MFQSSTHVDHASLEGQAFWNPDSDGIQYTIQRMYAKFAQTYLADEERQHDMILVFF